MGRFVTFAFFAGLGAYSALLLATEAATSQDFVRHYFSDIDGGRPFFAINTTVSTMFLACAAILLVFAACSARPNTPARTLFLLWGQAGLLAFLAFDDRFQLHEALAYRLEIGDHFIMLGWAGLELGLLLAAARRDQIPLSTFLWTGLGAGFFVLMMVFDALVPHDMIMRLSIEDLAKSWAAAFFLASAWTFARFHIGLSPKEQTLGDAVSRLAPHSLSGWAGTRPVPLHEDA